MRTRTLMVLSVLATVGVIAGALLVVTPAAHVARRAAPASTTTARPTVRQTARPAARALDVLRAWDRRRAAAWAAGDPAALRALYVPGSRTGRRDLAMLAAYGQRGLRVTAMRRQVLALRVRWNGPAALTLVVTDRLAEARVAGGTRAVLPRSRPSTRRIVLRHTSAGWCVGEVYDA